MLDLIEKLISKIKNSEYHIDAKLTIVQLFCIVCERLIMLVRGELRRIRFKKIGKYLFIGKRVKIKSYNRIIAGSGITIQDDCYINALCRNGITFGNNFSLGRKSVIECTGVISELGESLKIGNNVGISQNAFISVRGNIIIGNDTIIGPNVTILAENHCFSNINEKIRNQDTIRTGINIGENCWIGANVTILDGVTIGQGSVVAASALVNKNVEPYDIVGGIPAKVIKSRLEGNYENINDK